VTEAALMVVMAPRQGASGTFVFMLNIVMVIAIFYFLLIRPQRKEQERHEQMIASLGKGDEIVTAGGIVGTVIRVEDRQLIIKTAGDTKITVERSKVAKKIDSAGEELKSRTSGGS
jgi:preprotein translocase subunit YajC